VREIDLASWHDVPDRVESIKKSLEQIYGVKLNVTLSEVLLDNLYPTEDFLENDKIALVLMKIVEEDYDAPIITVKHGDDFFVLDGHHRSFIRKKLMRKTVQAYVLQFPEGTAYRAVVKRSLDSLPIKDVTVIDDLILRAWQRILSILKHYEAIYCVPFYVRKEQVRLTDLVATQSQVGKAQVNAIERLLVPIVCVRYHGKYYILDGHARTVRAEQLGMEFIPAMILYPENPIDYGIVKTAREMGLKGIEDVKITD